MRIAVVVVVCVFVMAFLLLLSDPLRKDVRDQERTLLRETPLGTSLETVDKYARRKGYKVTVAVNVGFYRQEGGKETVIGNKSIRAGIDPGAVRGRHRASQGHGDQVWPPQCA